MAPTKAPRRNRKQEMWDRLVNAMNQQVKRIKEMEEALNRAQAAVAQLDRAWENYCGVREDIGQLEAYLNSPERRQDLKAEESGLLPETLPRGVLSEDAIWNLLEQHDELLEQIRQII